MSLNFACWNAVESNQSIRWIRFLNNKNKTKIETLKSKQMRKMRELCNSCGNRLGGLCLQHKQPREISQNFAFLIFFATRNVKQLTWINSLLSHYRHFPLWIVLIKIDQVVELSTREDTSSILPSDMSIKNLEDIEKKNCNFLLKQMIFEVHYPIIYWHNFRNWNRRLTM